MVMPAREPSAHVVATSARPVRTVWDEMTARTVSGDQTGGAFSITELDLPLGWRRPAYVHHGVDECFVVRTGTLRFWLEDRAEPVVADQGDTVYVPRGLAHSAELTGGPASVLLIHTPASPEPTCTDQSAGWLDGVELLDVR
jgi:mannose-6-phosphate isomerase-like protein (cupin superfamily)